MVRCLKIRRARRSNDEKSKKNNVNLSNKIDVDSCDAALRFEDGRNSALHESAQEQNTNSTSNETGSSFFHPIHTVVWLRKTDVVSSFLEATCVDELSPKEWFDLLVDTVRNNMHDVALEILKKNTSLATMRNGEGTILHLLSQQDISDISFSPKAVLEGLVTVLAVVPYLSRLKKIFEQPLMRQRAWLLAKKLWAEIQKLEPAHAQELMKEPPILHDAARVGNVELITMLTRTYPALVLDTDSSGYTMFHIAVLYRQEAVFRLIHQLGSAKELITILRDKDGNNILHLAAKLAPLSRRKVVSGAALQMQRELMWFEEVEKIVPRWYLEMKNTDGDRPRDLFSKEHEWLLQDSKAWMKETTDSCMLIATIMLLVMFTATFTVPIDNNCGSGIPILFIRRSCFTRLVAMAMFCSTTCILIFRSILTSDYQEDHDSLLSLPMKLILGFATLLASIVSTIASTYFMLFNEGWAWDSKHFAAFSLVSLIAIRFGALRFKLLIDTIRSTYC